MRPKDMKKRKKETKLTPRYFYLNVCSCKNSFESTQASSNLENLINDRESFQAFLGLSSQQASLDHSTVSLKKLITGSFI